MLTYYILKSKAFTVKSGIKETWKAAEKEVKSLGRDKKGLSIYMVLCSYFQGNYSLYNSSPVVKKVSEKYLKFNLKSKCYCSDKRLAGLLAIQTMILFN